MDEFVERLKELNSTSKRAEIDHLRMVLFAAVLYGFRVGKVFKPFPGEYCLSETKEPDLKRLVCCFMIKTI